MARINREQKLLEEQQERDRENNKKQIQRTEGTAGQPERQNNHIPSHVKREVWRRDRGICQICGSRENLEFDHIIPISKDGSNTSRNVELLCEKCNRKKSNEIQ